MTMTKPKAAKTTRTHLCFPQKVYNVLQLCDDTHQEHILSWMNSGTAFKVHDVEAFERELLPKYFNTQKYASFTRTLCAHGFDCVRTGRQTGIYSHPKFNRNDPYAPSMIKRVKKAKNKKALKEGVSNRSHGLLLRDRKRPMAFPSLLDNPQYRMAEDDNATVLGQLYQTTRSQIADRATKALIRLPPGIHFVSSDESSDDSSAGGHDSASASASSVRSSSYHITDDLEEYDEDDFEPIPWSPQTSTQNCGVLDHSEGNSSLSSMEPRTIQEMKRNPDDLNALYNVLPMFSQPRYQALYDFSSPFVLPGLFYFMDISSFGLYWATFLIVGHTIQALFTAYGPNTADLVLRPKISMLKHIFMDIIWMHSLLSAMVLVPEYFGASSVMLAITFIGTQPPGLATNLKTHYHMNSQNQSVPFVHGEWWSADIVRWIFLGYLTAILCICLGHCFTVPTLKVIGVFLMNLTPLLAFESYRLLLSIPSRLEDQPGEKKRK
ncbi:unnamed protein product [Cylindrotheca closterium]|uniref:HSF-type DNA-binding domain-containing protein n=1 Tax=Cylindrotheca closterium TaxID=2856 RepID=A0AAD2G209_9STRA|nr:unnamed protein product [Cylindrotheca closterium]